MLLSRRTFTSAVAGALCAQGLHARETVSGNFTREIAEAARAAKKEPHPLITALVPNGCEANLRPVIAAFEQQTGIRVELRIAPVDDINTELLLAGLGQKATPDVAMIASFGLPDLAESNMLLATDRYEREYPVARLARERSLYSLADRYQRQTFGPQVDGDLYVMFYNRRFFNDGNLTESYLKRYGTPFEIPSSWQELDRMMRHVSEYSDNSHGGVLFRTPRYINWEFWARLHANRLLPFDERMRPTIASKTGIATIEALITASAWQHPGSKTHGLVDNWRAFAGGHCFCNIGWGGSQKHFRTHNENLTEGVTVAHLPGPSDADPALSIPLFNWGWNLVIPRNASNPLLAFLFTAFVVSPQMASTAVAQADGFLDPFQPDHYNDKRIVDTYGKDFLTVHREGMAGAIPDFYLPGRNDYMQALSASLILADRGRISAVEAAETIAKRWEGTTSLLGRDRQIAVWAELRSQYPAAILEQFQTTGV